MAQIDIWAVIVVYMSLIGDIIAVSAQSAENEKNREFNASQALINRNFTHNESYLSYLRSMYADSTKFQRTVADMQAAGLNPMLAASGGATGSVQSSPATGSQASAPSPSNLGQLIIQAQQIEIQKKLAEAEVSNKNADTNKKIVETEGTSLENEIKSATQAAQIEAASLKNELTRASVREIDGKLDEISAHVAYLAEQTKTESEKRSLMQAQAVLARANAHQIVELLPYEKALKSATTDAQREAALLSAAHTAYQNKLIDDGYIDAFIRNMGAQADSAEARAQLEQLKAALRTGDYSKTGDFVRGSWAKDFMQDITILLDNLNPLNNILK